MKTLRRHRLTLALLISLALHFIAFESGGWQLPSLHDLLARNEVVQPPLTLLEAHLVTSSQAALQGGQSVRPSARRATSSSSPPRVSAPAGVLAMPASPPVESTENGTPPLASTDADNSANPGQDMPEAMQSLAVDADSVSPPDEVGKVAPQNLIWQLPPRGRVRFAVTRGDQGFVVGQSVHHWNHDGKSYVLNSVTETTGLVALFRSVRVVWVSQGSVSNEGLRPHEFRTEKAGVRAEAASFDWNAMKLTLSGGDSRVLPLQPGTQDVLSMFYQLGALLPTLPHEQEGEALHIKPGNFDLFVTTGRKLERYRFDIIGEESLTLRQRGRQRTLHLRAPAGEQTIDIWLALELRGLPVRIRYTDGAGDSFDQKAEEIEFENPTDSTTGH